MDQAVAAGWGRARALLGLALNLAGLAIALPSHHGDTVTARQRAAAFRALRTAESLARRCIALMAFGMGEGAGKSRTSPPIPASFDTLRMRAGTGGAGGSKSRTPSFKLFEPVPSLASVFSVRAGPVAETLPAIPAERPRPDPDRLVDAGGLIRRLAALDHVLKHPKRAARRLLKRLSKPGARANPLRPGRAPGQVLRDKLESARLSELSLLVATLALMPLPP